MRKVKTAITVLLTLGIFVAGAAILLIVLYPKKHIDIIEQYARTYGVDANLVLAVIKAESNFNEKAVSQKGAIGLMQVMPSTGQWLADMLGLEGYTNEKLYEPETNILLGTKFLAYLIEKFDDLNAALAAYNAGEGNVSAWLNNPEYSGDGKTLKNIPYKETRQYIKKVKDYKFIYSYFR